MDGSFFLGARAVATEAVFRAVDPATGAAIEPPFSIATAAHIAEACQMADAAFDIYRETPPEARATFLERIAAEIEAIAGDLVERAMAETGLPRARLTGECGRTTGQLRLFAQVLRDGAWAGVVIDSAQPDRLPMPRPDLRQRRIAVGPVAVFGASNFPLAFSVAGGDTASALAAGCSVVCRGHAAHPGTSAMVGRAIGAAVLHCGLPQGVFSLLQGPDNSLGAALVADPNIMAVGFTGSRRGGLALMDIARKRHEPIPVYAEMSSVNPVILFPGALAARAAQLGQSYVGSLLLGAGQFCTNPGIVLAVAGPDLDDFIAAAAVSIGAADPQVMLTAGIHAAFADGVTALTDHPDIEMVARGADGSGCNRARTMLFATSAAAFIANPALAEEVFGAASIIVRAANMAEIRSILTAMEGQLTVTMHLDGDDVAIAAPFLPLLERKAGRILANGWPTGVEVCAAMVHGGPFPATSDPRTTSVGSAAIERFLRPVCYQGLPDALLPDAVKQANPLALPRAVDGERGR